MSFLGYPKVIPYTKFEHFGIIRFWVMLWTNKQTDRQTNNKQTASNVLPTPTDIVGVGNKTTEMMTTESDITTDRSRWVVGAAQQPADNVSPVELWRSSCSGETTDDVADD